MALHATLIALVLTRRNATAPLALVSRTITVELLKPEPEAVPAVIQSIPMPTPTPLRPARHVARAKPKVQPTLAPQALPVAEAPSQHQVETPTPAQPASPVLAAPAAALTQGKPTLALNAPKNVSHLDCQIVQPDYPMPSKRRGETGTVYVSFVVDLTGQIEDIELKKSSGYNRLDGAALDAMRGSSCKPYLENGEPVRAAYTQPFDFSLHD